jgi:hypothetical protein
MHYMKGIWLYRPSSIEGIAYFAEKVGDFFNAYSRWTV